jgi:hypothetical protein
MSNEPDGYTSGSTTATEEDGSSEFLEQLHTDLNRFVIERSRTNRQIRYAEFLVNNIRNELYPRSDDGNVTPTPVTVGERKGINRRIEEAKQVVAGLRNRLEEIELNISHTEGLLTMMTNPLPSFMEPPAAGGARRSQVVPPTRRRPRRRKTAKRKRKPRKKTRKRARR